MLIIKVNNLTYSYGGSNNTIFEKAMLTKMWLFQKDFETNIKDMSEGQKKKLQLKEEKHGF